jgi:hypothetical protein
MIIESLDVLKAEQDLQDRTRMQDIYRDINLIIDKIGELQVFPSLVWVWTWDIARDLYRNIQAGSEEEYCVTMEEEEVWQLFWEQADKNGFTLEYGTEDLDEHIRDWMIDQSIIELVQEEEDEDEDE